MKILIVEDDPIAGTVLEASLKALGHEVELAGDGEAGWASFVQAPRRLVISDWKMPGRDGLELCRKIRERGGDYTYFILLSNLANTAENLDQAMEAGADDFLAKPLKSAELKARLRVAERILNYSAQVRQLQEIIPICGYCRKLRDDQNYWSQVEEYISRQTGSEFSHGVCPDCYERVLIPEMKKLGVTPPVYGVYRRVGKWEGSASQQVDPRHPACGP